FGNKQGDQIIYIFFSLPKRRQWEMCPPQQLIKIAVKISPANFFPQIPGGRNQPTRAIPLIGDQYAQPLLNLYRNLLSIFQVQRSPAEGTCYRIGEQFVPFLQFQTTAVHRNEGMVSTRTGLMDRQSEHFLAGPLFSRDPDRDIHLTVFLGGLNRFAKSAAFAHKPMK